MQMQYTAGIYFLYQALQFALQYSKAEGGQCACQDTDNESHTWCGQVAGAADGYSACQSGIGDVSRGNFLSQSGGDKIGGQGRAAKRQNDVHNSGRNFRRCDQS